MTPKQLEKKAKQLLYRKRLADTIEPIEDRIKAYMQVEEKEKLLTKSFIISFNGEELIISLRPRIDPRQLNLEFKGSPSTNPAKG